MQRSEHSKRSRVAVLMLAGLMAMTTAACGDDDDGEQSAPTTTEATVAPVRGADVVTIDMVDHAFQVSGALTAGGTLRLANKGTEFHMMGMGRFKPGKTMGDLQRALAEAAGPSTTTTAGRATSTTLAGSTTTTARGATTTTTRAGSTSTTALAGGQREDPTAEILDEVGLPGGIVGPNESVEVTVPTLQPGTYALLCFLPTEGEGTPHFAKGMVGQLEVVAGTAPPPPTADATYKVTPGRALEGPTTLTAGRHTIKFEAAAGSEQLEPGIARLNAGTTFSRFNSQLEDLFEGNDPPPKGAATRVPGQVLFGGFDFLGETTLYVTADFKAGSYAIVANDTDVATSVTPREIINVRVT